MMAITTISSMSVKPRRHLPLRIWFTIAVSIHGFREHIENILAAPGIRGRLVLHAALAPFGIAGHRILRNPPQKFELSGLSIATDGVSQLDAFDQNLERGRETVGFRVACLDFALVAYVFVLIDGVTHLAQV